MGEAICKSYLITGYYPKYIKKLYNSTTTARTQLKHGQNSSTDFLKEDTQMNNRQLKRCYTSISSEK